MIFAAKRRVNSVIELGIKFDNPIFFFQTSLITEFTLIQSNDLQFTSYEYIHEHQAELYSFL